jgi:hypothetical protein
VRVSVLNPSENLDTPVWGAAAIGRVLGRSERQAFHLLEKRLIDATKVGAIWVSTPRRLLRGIAEQGRAS